ncbi:hypothetical protein [Streptomyces acidiscabies]|uniref:hypothetical protein n=1 Tax=Streptomyces acidiscabies TaxID=42234 RepID=UPI0038F6DB7C
MVLMAGRATTSDIEPHDFEAFLTTRDGLDGPGYRAEIVQGSITTSPVLYVFPGDERAYGPDIHAASRNSSRTSSPRLDGEALSFVAELTSSATRDNEPDGEGPRPRQGRGPRLPPPRHAGGGHRPAGAFGPGGFRRP